MKNNTRIEVIDGLTKEIWLKILEHLNCGNFGPLALPAPSSSLYSVPIVFECSNACICS